ncbi:MULTISPECIES: ArsR/SmtB family transcription factor [Pseudomonas]|uniref:ArsR/SmtB family transcription factor n=1 Tax=Pseudomonas TaxID=286 RepID=UPI0005A86BBC|nr:MULTISPECIES: metalloregulator ArsR/SmtB family transcription factor [Pseudomonas]KAB0534225.1 helix-turn-helix transcriptional regulator [Pseudomonas chlororaphis subsp. aureofaciens]TSD28019.1 helix-turn-helix transcriptional regulator [Pseudomonas sp. ATCC 13985]WDG46466.1 metalloregulator ArsR/SmtB family transcription factor [Pseudomonas chlororaphis]WDG58637.1 metalloregulator ArsR/SmtB family transcription factor [Pseudomonas chlororaphis]WDG64846.1 metalloregulator ArsR/SmtB family 
MAPDTSSPSLLPVAALLDGSAMIFAALGDETRLRLVTILCGGGAMSITQLTLGTDISRQAVTKHLQVLAQAGLVRDAKLGRERLWAFEPGRLAEARRSLEVISQQWDQALGQLQAFVES